MILILAFVLGFGVGWLRAKKREGNTADCVQYGIGHAFAFMLVAVALVMLLPMQG